MVESTLPADGAFSAWLPVLGNRHPRPILLRVESSCAVWTRRSAGTHSPAEGHLGGFQVWEIMSKAAVNTRLGEN